MREEQEAFSLFCTKTPIACSARGGNNLISGSFRCSSIMRGEESIDTAVGARQVPPEIAVLFF